LSKYNEASQLHKEINEKKRISNRLKNRSTEILNINLNAQDLNSESLNFTSPTPKFHKLKNTLKTALEHNSIIKSKFSKSMKAHVSILHKNSDYKYEARKNATNTIKYETRLTKTLHGGFYRGNYTDFEAESNIKSILISNPTKNLSQDFSKANPELATFRGIFAITNTSLFLLKRKLSIIIGI
jgi:hypothetical protein